ncbi:hypothetical protein GC175_15790 [bacterium]|nr:hypothetical protein [bacterium]
MADQSINVLRYGVDAPLPEERTLHAGPLSVLYSEGDLRAIRLGDREILNRVYVAVRDHNWNTIPIVLSNVQLEDNGDNFHIAYDADHRQDNIDFHWQGTIHGAADGTITFAMDGAARSTFLRNRIGFCVLHPAHVAGASCTVEHVDGTTEESQFPQHISADQPIFDIRAIHNTVQDGVDGPVLLEVRMEGDTFEMEDQRNWTDASYKTYCTPLGLPFPVEITAGTPVQQQITVRLHGETSTQDDSNTPPVQLRVERRAVGEMPRIGLGLSSQEMVLARREIERLRAMQISHLRVDVDFTRSDWQDELRRAVDEADAIGTRLEIALHLSDDADAELATLRRVVNDLRPAVQHWLIYRKGAEGIEAHWIDLARRHLSDYDHVEFGAGTDAYFTELNRERPPAAVLDLICYSINPQVHAFDNRSLMETLPVQATTVESARFLAAGRPIAVTPITLQPRFNPNATSAEAEISGELPSQVDVRQMSLFAAAWTVGSLKAMAESSVQSVTYFETVGWRGVLESVNGSPLPERFRSQPGEVFPLYHVLSDVARCAGAPVLFTENNAADRVTGFAFQRDGQIHVLVANLTNAPQEVTIHHGGNRVHVRMLNEHNVRAAMATPDAYRNEESPPIDPAHGQTSLRLTAYAVAMLGIGD